MSSTSTVLVLMVGSVSAAHARPSLLVAVALLIWRSTRPANGLGGTATRPQPEPSLLVSRVTRRRWQHAEPCTKQSVWAT